MKIYGSLTVAFLHSSAASLWDELDSLAVENTRQIISDGLLILQQFVPGSKVNCPDDNTAILVARCASWPTTRSGANGSQWLLTWLPN